MFSIKKRTLAALAALRATQAAYDECVGTYSEQTCAASIPLEHARRVAAGMCVPV